MHGPWPEIRALASFLDTALDKPDGRYDYPTYLALPVLVPVDPQPLEDVGAPERPLAAGVQNTLVPGDDSAVEPCVRGWLG
ncbi:hypothetical protein, partial [Streptomyces sp. EL9]|uniref:hypothetical protein n=1 Tax=Streptomyces sp. EL9 TaxID=2841666 RepID=UPI002095EAA8